MGSAQGFEPALWARISQEMCWCATAIPESLGGLGLGRVELVLMLEQMGRRQTCAPFFSTVALAATALSEFGSVSAQNWWLPKIAQNSLRVTLALSAHGVQFDEKSPGASAARLDDGWQLEGSFSHVPDGDSAELILIVAKIVHEEEDEAFGLFAVPKGSQGMSTTPLISWDTTRRLAKVELSGLQLQAADRIDTGTHSKLALARIEALAALLLSAEQLGGAQQCLDLSLAHTAQRVQFGQPIAAFQAVKHRCAEMMVRIEATRSIVYGAAALSDTQTLKTELLMQAGAAKAQASETFFFCAQEAVQLHGGIGFTWEYDPQLYFKRAQASCNWLGTADQWRERIASTLLD